MDRTPASRTLRPNPAAGIFLRPARDSEKDALEALQRRASLANPGDREALLANPEAIEVPIAQIRSGQVHVAQLDGSVVGFAAIVPRAAGGSDLDALFVEPGMWGRGIGRVLVEHCCAEACRHGSRVLRVIGNPHAEGFYRACGFELEGRTRTRFGEGLLMRRPLGGPGDGPPLQSPPG